MDGFDQHLRLPWVFSASTNWNNPKAFFVYHQQFEDLFWSHHDAAHASRFGKHVVWTAGKSTSKRSTLGSSKLSWAVLSSNVPKITAKCWRSTKFGRMAESVDSISNQRGDRCCGSNFHEHSKKSRRTSSFRSAAAAKSIKLGETTFSAFTRGVGCHSSDVDT